MIFEELINTTSYIVKLLPISSFGEPLNFVVAPLFYFNIKYSLELCKSEIKFNRQLPPMSKCKHVSPHKTICEIPEIRVK